MANAIPVTQQEPKKRKVEVAPAVDANGVQLPGDYVSQVRENLGSPSDFNKPKSVTEISMPINSATVDAQGNTVVGVTTHKAIRTDY